MKNAAGFALVWTLSKIPHRVRFSKTSSIPRHGGCILVANHLSVTEVLALGRVVIGHRRFPHTLAMAQVFRWPVVGWLARLTGQIPVERETSTAATSLTAAGDRLRLGQLVVIYPEGRLTTTSDLRPGPGKTGAARLALQHPEIPVVPVGTWGPRPGARHVWCRHHARLSVGAAVDLSPWTGKADDAAAVRAATEAIMTAITHQVEAVRGRPFADRAGEAS